MSSVSRRRAVPRLRARPRSIAEALSPLFSVILPAEVPVRFEFWDGSGVGPATVSSGHESGTGVVRVLSPDALRRILWSPDELGFGRAYVVGEIEVDGDLCEVLRALERAAPRDLRLGVRALPAAMRAAAGAGALGPPLARPPEEARPEGALHSLGRDKQVISHHYDVGNRFYELVLGESMTYSCARFLTPTTTLSQAQLAKHDLVCRKLGLHERPGMRLLDVGCGWGSMAIHAAGTYGAKVVGVTLSRFQAELARQRVKQAGLDDLVEIREQDYRSIGSEQFEAISSIGMFEHVGSARTGEYFATMRGLLVSRGRLLNHAISSVGGSRLGRRSFVGRYVFPDGELIDVGDVVLAMERAGFEVRDVESLREHYAETLRAWVGNLERRWDEAVREVGSTRARVWRLYMAGSANGFENGGLGLHQVLGVVPGPGGESGLPRTRADWR